MEEDVEASREDERRRGAALLDPPADSNCVGGLGREDWTNLNIVEEASDGGDDPPRHADLSQDSEDKGVRNRIEGAGSIEEEQVVLFSLGEARVEIGGDGVDMVRADPVGDESLLVRVESGAKSGSDGFGEAFSYESVRGIRNRDGAGVRDQHGGFLGE